MPLVFTTMGGMGKAAKVTYGQIAGLIATKRDQPYSQSHRMDAMCAWLQLGEIGSHMSLGAVPFHSRPASSEIELATSMEKISH